MKTTGNHFQSSTSPPSIKTLNALVFLTDEPDESSYSDIANAIISYGEKILPLLKIKLQNTVELYHRQRIEHLISAIEQQDIIYRLKTWRDKREYDLMEPYFILSRYFSPKADWNSIGFQIIMMIEQAEKEMNYNLTPLEQVKTLNHIIYDINKFKGEAFTVNKPEYYFANTLFEKRIGNPLTLGILYCIIAERLGLPIYAIDLPNHFILAFCKKTESFPQLEDVLFYINPFNNGIVLTRKDIRNYLSQIKVDSELKYFEPTKNNMIVKKLFYTLIETYFMSGNNNEANELRKIMNY